MSTTTEHLWYIPNAVDSGHRGDTVSADHNSLETLTRHARALEENGWAGALIGTGWGRPDTFTLATALIARTTRFQPLIAIRPGYWRPAHLAAAGATLDRLSDGRVRFNIVSGQDDLAAYGDSERDQAQRYERTREFMRLIRRLWTKENVTFEGAYFQVTASTAQPRIRVSGDRRHPPLYFGGASEAAERVAAAGQQRLFDLQARGEVTAISTPRPESSVAAERGRPGWSAPRKRRAVPAQIPRSGHHQVHPVGHALSARDRTAGPDLAAPVS